MKIDVHRFELSDERLGLHIRMDGKEVFEISAGESEDMTLTRDMSDCYKIPELLRLAHKAGLAGEPFVIEQHEDLPQ